MTSTAKKWLYIALGVFVVLVFLGIGGIFVTVTYVQNHLNVSRPAESDAMQAFAEIHQRFGDRTPLIEWKDDVPGMSAVPASNSNSKQLTTLHLIAWDDDQGQLAKIDLPFWLLRLKSGPIKFGSAAYRFDDERVRMTVEDIDRYGPGIIMDYTRRGNRALIWAE
jgi:uncharacterized protein YneF (UPF0154 family)